MNQSLPRKPSPSRWLVPAAFVLFSIIMALTSGGFLEADEVTHFLDARGVWNHWVTLTDIWGRMGCTGLYSLVAPLGLTAARLLAVLVTTLTGLATGIVAQHFIQSYPNPLAKNSWIARHAVAIVWFLLFAQPFFALNCFTVMTEMLLACPWIWTVVILIRNRARPHRGIILAGAILGLGGLMRPEGWIAVAAWPLCAFLWLRQTDIQDSYQRTALQRLKLLALSTLAAGLPSLAWYLLGVIGHSTNGHGDWNWVITGWPWEVKDKYATSPLIFFQRSMIAMAIWLWLPIAIAIAGFWRTPKPITPQFPASPSPTLASSRTVPSPTNSQTPVAPSPPPANLLEKTKPQPIPAHFPSQGKMLLVAPLLAVFFIHGVLGSFGLFGSMSLPRYYISVAPMAAILAMLGLIRIERFASFARAIPFRAVVILTPIATLILLISMKLLPMAESPEMRRLDVVLAELRHRVTPDQYRNRIIAFHPYVILALGLPPGTPVDERAWSPDAMASPLGTLLVTDSMLWVAEHRPPPEQLTAWGYRIDPSVAAKVDAATVEAEPWAVNWPRPGAVRIWIKQLPASPPN